MAMASNIKIVLPGDSVLVEPTATLGPGVYMRGDTGPPITCRAGILRGDPNDKVWVDFDSKRVRNLLFVHIIIRFTTRIVCCSSR